MRKLTLAAIVALVLILSACLAATTRPGDAPAVTSPAAQTTVATTATEADTTSVAAASDAAAVTDTVSAVVTLSGDTVTVDGSGVTVDGTVVTVEEPGVYRISGMLDNGQLAVDGDVVLLLAGVDITNAAGAPINVRNADNTIITLVDGTENRLTDGAEYIFPDAETDEPDAALFSDDDLTINGGGTLIVTANYNHGIVGKDDLAIDLTPGSGAIIVTAVNDGIKGRDSLLVQGGALTIDAGGDGMQSNNDEDADKGVVTIAGGTIVITATEDGIQAESRLTVSGGDLTLTTGGGSTFTAADSAKGLKAGVDMTITGGTIVVDAADDAVHANESITISGGVLQLASGDDGVHADATLQIDGGTITVSKSYEGLESAVIVINAGDIQVTASDDGINVAGGADGSAVNGRPGQNQFAASSDYRLTINGGTIVVNALGDGLDANGWIEMTGGVVIVNGPTANNNGALDYDGGFSITGGTLVAAGSAGMAQAPDTTSTQNSLLYTFAATQPAETMVHIEDAAGNSLLTFTPTHDFQSIVLSSPALTDGATYTVYTGGAADGAGSDGLYSGAYTPGTLVESFAAAGVVTQAGAQVGGFRGRPPGGGPGGQPPSGPPPGDATRP